MGNWNTFTFECSSPHLHCVFIPMHAQMLSTLIKARPCDQHYRAINKHIVMQVSVGKQNSVYWWYSILFNSINTCELYCMFQWCLIVLSWSCHNHNTWLDLWKPIRIAHWKFRDNPFKRFQCTITSQGLWAREWSLPRR